MLHISSLQQDGYNHCVCSRAGPVRKHAFFMCDSPQQAATSNGTVPEAYPVPAQAVLMNSYEVCSDALGGKSTYHVFSQLEVCQGLPFPHALPCTSKGKASSAAAAMSDLGGLTRSFQVMAGAADESTAKHMDPMK